MEKRQAGGKKALRTERRGPFRSGWIREGGQSHLAAIISPMSAWFGRLLCVTVPPVSQTEERNCTTSFEPQTTSPSASPLRIPSRFFMLILRLDVRNHERRESLPTAVKAQIRLRRGAAVGSEVSALRDWRCSRPIYRKCLTSTLRERSKTEET